MYNMIFKAHEKWNHSFRLIMYNFIVQKWLAWFGWNPLYYSDQSNIYIYTKNKRICLIYFLFFYKYVSSTMSTHYYDNVIFGVNKIDGWIRQYLHNQLVVTAFHHLMLIVTKFKQNQSPNRPNLCGVFWSSLNLIFAVLIWWPRKLLL